MKQAVRSWRFIGSLTALVYTVILHFSCRFGPVFSGDSIQYLNLANRIKHFQWPASDKWLQFYPTLISIVDFFCNDLIYAAFIVNVVLLTLIVLVLNYLFYRLFNDYKLNILLGLLLLADRELYFHSMTVMAEMCFLALLMILYIFIFNIIDNKAIVSKVDLIPIFAISFLILMTKFNALIAFIVVSYFLFDFSGKRYYWSAIYLFLLAVLYGLHGHLFSTYGVFANNLLSLSMLDLNLFFQGFHKFISVLVEYLSAPLLGELYNNLSPNTSIVFFVLFACLFYFQVKKKGRRSHDFIILSFIFLYVIIFIVVAKSSKAAQIDLRQMFIPVFLLNIYLFIRIYQWNNNWKYFLMSVIFILGGYKTLRRFQAFNEVGYGDFNVTMEGWRNFEVIKAAKNKIVKTGIVDSAIYTNKFKSLGVDFGFIELGKSPNIGYWTDKGYKSPTAVDLKFFFKNKITSNNGILIYVTDDFEEMYNTCKREATEDVVLEIFKDGFIVYKRQPVIPNPQT